MTEMRFKQFLRKPLEITIGTETLVFKPLPIGEFGQDLRRLAVRIHEITKQNKDVSQGDFIMSIMSDEEYDAIAMRLMIGEVKISFPELSEDQVQELVSLNYSEVLSATLFVNMPAGKRDMAFEKARAIIEKNKGDQGEK